MSKAKRLLKAVFFDMDGVLLDTMPYHVTAWVRAFNEFGYYPDELSFYLNEGVKHPITVKERLRELGVDNPDEELVERIYLRKRSIYEEICVLKPMPGAQQLVGELCGQVKLAIVSGGVRNMVMKAAALFDNCFDLLVDYDCTRDGKPAPAPYLYAIEKIGVSPERILAIENSPTGIRSALGAGLTCWAICSTLAPRYLQEAHRVFAGFAEIEAALFEEYELAAIKKIR